MEMFLFLFNANRVNKTPEFNHKNSPDREQNKYFHPHATMRVLNFFPHLKISRVVDVELFE